MNKTTIKKNLKILIIFLIVCTIALGGSYFAFHYIYNEGVFNKEYENLYYMLTILISGWITYTLKDIF